MRVIQWHSIDSERVLSCVLKGSREEVEMTPPLLMPIQQRERLQLLHYMRVQCARIYACDL